MKTYSDPFETLLADVIQEIAEEMNKPQSQDISHLTFRGKVVYLEHDHKNKNKNN